MNKKTVYIVTGILLIFFSIQISFMFESTIIVFITKVCMAFVWWFLLWKASNIK